MSKLLTVLTLLTFSLSALAIRPKIAKTPGRKNMEAMPPEAILSGEDIIRSCCDITFKAKDSRNRLKTIRVKVSGPDNIKITGANRVLRKQLEAHIKEELKADNLVEHELTKSIKAFIQTNGR